MLGEVLTAIVTPFDREGRVDLDRFRELATFLVENGSDGIVVCGTTGESPTLSDAEKFQLWEAAVDLLGGRATVVAGTGTYDTAHSIHLTKKATELGVDAVLVVTPYYSKPPQRAIVAHFEAIAAASDKPIVVYNIPGRVVVNIEPQTIERLAKIETVRAYREGDRARAKQLDDELQPAYDLLKVVTNPIAIKAALNLLGHEVGGLRLPLVEADEAETAAVRACLERLGALVPA